MAVTKCIRAQYALDDIMHMNTMLLLIHSSSRNDQSLLHPNAGLKIRQLGAKEGTVEWSPCNGRD